MANQCSFAHGHHELRSKTHIGQLYRTKVCKQFADVGYCSYGPRCQYLHNDGRFSTRLDSFLDKVLSKTGVASTDWLADAIARAGKASPALPVFLRLRG